MYFNYPYLKATIQNMYSIIPITFKQVTWRHTCTPVLHLPEKNAVHQTGCRKQSTLHH